MAHKRLLNILQCVICLIAGSFIAWFMVKEFGLLSIQELTIRQVIAFDLVWAFDVFGCFGLLLAIKLWLKERREKETRKKS